MLVRDAMEEGSAALNELEKEGVIQRFEYCFELAWKAVKDYLEVHGVVMAVITPRQVLKEAFAARVLADGQVWIDMLDHRNVLSHRYDERSFDAATLAIESRYLGTLDALRVWLLEREGGAS